MGSVLGTGLASFIGGFQVFCSLRWQCPPPAAQQDAVSRPPPCYSQNSPHPHRNIAPGPHKTNQKALMRQTSAYHFPKPGPMVRALCAFCSTQALTGRWLSATSFSTPLHPFLFCTGSCSVVKYTSNMPVHWVVAACLSTSAAGPSHSKASVLPKNARLSRNSPRASGETQKEANLPHDCWTHFFFVAGLGAGFSYF